MPRCSIWLSHMSLGSCLIRECLSRCTRRRERVTHADPARSSKSWGVSAQCPARNRTGPKTQTRARSPCFSSYSWKGRGHGAACGSYCGGGHRYKLTAIVAECAAAFAQSLRMFFALVAHIETVGGLKWSLFKKIILRAIIIINLLSYYYY